VFLKITKDYEFENGKYRLIITKCDKTQYFDQTLQADEREILNKVYIYKRRRNKWVAIDDKKARERIKMHTLMGDLTDEDGRADDR
jgi:hypothetical protein